MDNYNVKYDEKIAKQAGCITMEGLFDKAKKAIIAEKTVIILIEESKDKREIAIAGNHLGVTGELGALVIQHMENIKNDSGKELANLHLNALIDSLKQYWTQG